MWDLVCCITSFFFYHIYNYLIMVYMKFRKNMIHYRALQLMLSIEFQVRISRLNDISNRPINLVKLNLNSNFSNLLYEKQSFILNYSKFWYWRNQTNMLHFVIFSHPHKKPIFWRFPILGAFTSWFLISFFMENGEGLLWIVQGMGLSLKASWSLNGVHTSLKDSRAFEFESKIKLDPLILQKCRWKYQ